MTKPGHKEPLRDNTSRADMSPHAEEDQLRIGQEPEVVDSIPETPPGLRLTEKEQTRVDNLKDSGLDAGTAAFYAVSAAKARRLVGHHYSSGLAAKYSRGEGEKSREGQRKDISDEVLPELLRDVNSQTSDESPNPIQKDT